MLEREGERRRRKKERRRKRRMEEGGRGETAQKAGLTQWDWYNS